MSEIVEIPPAPVLARPKRTALEVLIVTGGKLVTLVSLFGCGIIAARSLGPADNGVFGAALALLLLLDGMIGSPLDFATVRFGTLYASEPSRVQQIMSALFRIKVLLGVVVLLGMWGAAGPIAAALFKDPSKSDSVLIIGAALLPVLAMRSTAAFLQLQLRFSAYAALDLSLGLLRLGVFAGFYFADIRSPGAYLAAYGLTTFIPFLTGLFIFRQKFLFAPLPSRRYLLEMTRYSGAVGGIIILGSITGRADILVLKAFAEPVAAGHYAAAAQLAGIGSIVSMYVSIALQPRLLPMVQNGTIRKFLTANVYAVVAGAIVAIPVIIWVLPPLISFLLGTTYEPAAPLLQILAIGCLLDFLTVPVFFTLSLQFQPRTALHGEAILTLLFLALAPVAAHHGPVAMAWFVTALRLAKLLLYAWISQRIMRATPAGVRSFTAPPTSTANALPKFSHKLPERNPLHNHSRKHIILGAQDTSIPHHPASPSEHEPITS